MFWHIIRDRIPSTQKKQISVFDPDFGKKTNTSSVTFASSSPVPTSNSASLHHESKRSRFFTNFAYVSNVSSSSQNPIPININNSLLSINFYLEGKKDDDNRMRILFDIGAAMNTGYLNYHLWVVSQRSERIVEYLQCGEGTEYAVVQLLTALDLDIDSKSSAHGQMTVVIRYHALFLEQ